jgi:DNA-binding response OmpR family regulator
MPAEGPHPHAAGADSGQARTPPQPPWPKVLVVDDDPAVSKAIKIRLQAYGVEVLRAFNAMQGYWTALKETPNVIVLDYRMPGGYGNFLLCKLQSHPLTEKIPAIVLTGQKRGRDKDYFLERELLCLGASAFLNKPLDFDALLNELRRYIRLEVYQGPTPPRPARV